VAKLKMVKKYGESEFTVSFEFWK